MLQDSWVDSLFARMAVRYGSAWANKWEGLDMQSVRADWAEELAMFENWPEAIAYGLVNLPLDRPPNVGQFRDLCRGAPARRPKLQAVPAVEMSEELRAERHAAVQEQLRRVRAKLTGQR